MDYIAFCKRFYGATGIPVNLLLSGKTLYSSLGENLSYMPGETWPVYEPRRNPGFASLNGELEYGRVHVENSEYDLFMGPVFVAPPTDQELDVIMDEQRVPEEYRAEMRELLLHIPVCSHPQCLRYLAFLHLCLNGRDVPVEDFYSEEDTQLYERTQQQVETGVESRENEKGSSSYAFELQMYHMVELGDVSRLKAFLEGTKQFPEEGRVAKTALRQAKNIFIGVASKAVLMGAVPGGLDADKAYQLAGLYIQECEQMQTAEDVHRLQYIMLMDLCQRTGNARMPQNVSSEIYRCIHYIRNHTNLPLTVEDVAGQINRSRSYLMRRFKEETGQQVNAFITQCKMEEACDLLIYSETPLAEISTYLGFSSQSYFQNVFKKEFGLTPMQYRKLNSKIR